MRIISGHAKGRKLRTPPNGSTTIRPTSDRAREAIFSIIASQLVGKNVLDLFCGTGAFGLEALSRGAIGATFVDNHKGSLELTYSNLQLCLPAFSNSDEAVEPEIALHKYNLSRKNLFSEKCPFDISQFQVIFLDPPYSKGIAENVLTELDNYITSSSKKIIIAEERSNLSAPNNFKNIKLQDTRNYGDTSFWLYSSN